jgi:hypothetical protein
VKPSVYLSPIAQPISRSPATKSAIHADDMVHPFTG